MKFIEFKRQLCRDGYYYSCGIMFSFDDIVRIIECSEDYHRTNIVTKDGTVCPVDEEYSEVVKKIRKAETEMNEKSM